MSGGVLHVNKTSCFKRDDSEDAGCRGIWKQQEDNRPIVEQQNIQIEQQKHEDQLTHRVQDPEEKENDGYRYDAKEKGNNEYEGESGRHKSAAKRSLRMRKKSY